MSTQVDFDLLIHEFNERYIAHIPRLSLRQCRSIKGILYMRLTILEITICAKCLSLGESIRVCYNRSGEVHLSDCVWSSYNVTEGPDTCHCCSALERPAEYFRNR